MGVLNTNSPYEDDADDRQGRVAVSSTPESWFNINTDQNPGGRDETVPYPDEIAHTDKGDFVVLTRDENNNVVLGATALVNNLKINVDDRIMPGYLKFVHKDGQTYEPDIDSIEKEFLFYYVNE